MSEMLRLMSVDRNKLRLDLEDARARADLLSDKLAEEKACQAWYAKELAMAHSEIRSLESDLDTANYELDEARTRIQELEES